MFSSTIDMKQPVTNFNQIGTLLFRSGTPARVINLITLYRIITFPLLVYLVVVDDIALFKWLLLASFFTDAIDGFLARKYNATSILGAKLDSIGDDLTVLAAAIGLFSVRFDFVREYAAIFIALFALFAIQVAVSFYRYAKISTFHTYLAKVAAVVTACFLLSVFFFDGISYPLFYTAAAITGLELTEEIMLAAVLKEYRSNVHGLYWVLRPKANRKKSGLFRR
jgi:cardiolipin synthase